MIERKQCISVWSDMNTWLDFCIMVSESDLQKAEEIIRKAYDEWWDLPDIQFEPLADWICRNLNRNEIEYDIYFKDEKEE
jgi:hypothetical protein